MNELQKIKKFQDPNVNIGDLNSLVDILNAMVGVINTFSKQVEFTNSAIKKFDMQMQEIDKVVTEMLEQEKES